MRRALLDAAPARVKRRLGIPSMQQGIIPLAAIGVRRLARWLRSVLRDFVRGIVTAGCLILSGAGAAFAHPHVWVTMKCELVYAADGSVTGVRHAWAFDDMYSAFATQGLKHKSDAFTRAELAPLAEVNVASLKEYGYFTIAKASGKKRPFNEPVDYWLDYSDSRLTLHFTLPFKSPVAARDLALEIYDPTWFVEFSFVESNPVVLVDAPDACRLKVQRPTGFSSAQGQQLSEDFFNTLTASSNWGAQFANKVLVQCP
jgi:ABC-type uncharacterized transport system substrate-binding protein